MSLKIEFVERAGRKGANRAALCREFGISRQVGYKWIKRFEKYGYDGLDDRSRRPKSSPLITAEDVVIAIVEARNMHPSWGPRKLIRLLSRRLGEDTPSERTIARVLDRFGQIRRKRKRRPLSIIERAPDVVPKVSNDVWTIDFKGWWRTSDGKRCDPFTVRDAYSRYVLAIELIQPKAQYVRAVLQRLFKKHGVPKAIQCDNGTPFISVLGRAGLTSLSAWWISLGIAIVRSRLAHPQDNGGHERMHRDMAIDIEAHPAATTKAQQHACNKWRQEFNHVRPHEALKGRTPSELYKPVFTAPRVRMPVYPPQWITRRVKRNGEVQISKVTKYLSLALAGYFVALQPLGGIRFRVWFYDMDLGTLELGPTNQAVQAAIEQLEKKRAA